MSEPITPQPAPKQNIKANQVRRSDGGEIHLSDEDLRKKHQKRDSMHGVARYSDGGEIQS